MNGVKPLHAALWAVAVAIVGCAAMEVVLWLSSL